ncbi:MAG: bifunctional (p)ppGpp synthetase/guanosine-3',5'-bis(diphosphate) 3'-pyrophosphohydrolase [Flavobacteriaceae bacterium]|nr:bifunctional (p)ppGpp synthetase/guanosine-3',5'-bis(diphosphate) 3'-pyrophosphohydrolase [Flavobacteriaceae bacterium]
MEEYNLTPEEENKEIARRYKDLLKDSYQDLTDDDKKEIRRAFDLALEAHKHQRRKTGEPYIFHPIAVAKIVAKQIGLDTTSIISALLHDVIEDTEYTAEDIKEMFGETVAKIVVGLTKISRLKKDQDVSIQAENYRKMLLTLNDDVRVILIKIADRLHNMQTMDAMPPHKQVRISSETLYIYAPLAHRLGLYNIKTELENLGLKYTDPEMYFDIKEKIHKNKEEHEKYIESFSNKIRESLDKEGFQYDIKGRLKSIYSIRKKMINQGIDYDEIYDKLAIRIVYKSSEKNEKFDAWKIYSIITEHFTPNPSRLRDWITQPKSTGYEALHVTVMGPQGKWVEVQIRSERMNEIAEKGYAAHYKYKHKSERESGLDDWLNMIKESLENSDLNAFDFVENFKLDLYAKEIYVFTPNGELKSLPKGATALDFAYAVHTEVGSTCRGTKVNGKIVPISYKLKSGDQVEVITSKGQKPSSNWLDFVITSRAKTKIKNSLKEKEKQIAEEGKEVLVRKLRHLKISFSEKIVNELVSYFKLKTSLDLFYRVGNGTITNEQLKSFVASRSNALVNFFKSKIIRKNTTNDVVKEEVTTNYDLLVFGNDQQKLDYSLANCCNPIPGDSVFGFVTVNDGIRVHKKTCPNAVRMQANFAYRIIDAKWIDSTKQEFKTKIEIHGLDILGITNNITKVISESLGVNIHSLNMKGEDGEFKGEIVMTVNNLKQVSKICRAISRVEGVDKVRRVY